MTDPPLAGVTVVEVGVFMAAPYAALQLADLGARVVKVEPPSGDPVRGTGPHLDGHSSPFLRLNRGKESVVLDLKSPGGVEAFRRLVASADVLVENLRPGAMRGLGLGYDDLRSVNPRLVYASASGWGQDGPLSPLPGLDIMAQARGGLMSITGTPDGAPVKVGVPLCDLVCGLYTAMAVLAALRERDRSGEGQHVDVSLLESAVSLAVWEAGTWFATGRVPRPLGSAHQTQAPYQAVRAADGWVTVGAITPRTWEAFCRALELEDLLGDERLATSASRHASLAELVPRIEAATSELAVDEVVRRLDEAGVPCAPINDYGQVFTDPHLQARGFFWDAPHRALGAVRQVGSPMRFARTPAHRGEAGPPLGSGTRQALRQLGYDDEQVEAMLAAGTAVAEGRTP